MFLGSISQCQTFDHPSPDSVILVGRQRYSGQNANNSHDNH